MRSFALPLLLLPASALAAFNLLDLSSEDQIPTGSGDMACLEAYNSTIECDPKILEIGKRMGQSSPVLPTEEELDELCTSTCLNSLRKWVRGGDGCEGEEYLGFFGLLNGTSEFFGGADYSVADIQQYWVTTTFHQYCNVNPKPKPGQPKYCIHINSTDPKTSYFPAYFDSSDPDSFCKENPCGAMSAYLWGPVNVTYVYDSTQQFPNDDQEPAMKTYSELCPDGDANGYPKREKDISAQELQSSTDEPLVVGGSDDTPTSSDGDDSNTTDNKDGKDTTGGDDDTSDAATTTGTGDDSTSTGEAAPEETDSNAAPGSKVVSFSAMIAAFVATAAYMVL